MTKIFGKRIKRELLWTLLEAVIKAIGILVVCLHCAWASQFATKRSIAGERNIQDYLDGLPQTKNAELKRLFEKGYSLYEDEKYVEAIGPFQACLKLKTEDSEREALLILIGNAFCTLGKLKEAEDHYQEALLIGRRIKDKEGEASSLGNMGLIYQAKGDLDQALKYMNEALKIFEDIGMPEQIGKVKRNIERVSQQMKQMKK